MEDKLEVSLQAIKTLGKVESSLQSKISDMQQVLDVLRVMGPVKKTLLALQSTEASLKRHIAKAKEEMDVGIANTKQTLEVNRLSIEKEQVLTDLKLASLKERVAEATASANAEITKIQASAAMAVLKAGTDSQAKIATSLKAAEIAKAGEEAAIAKKEKAEAVYKQYTKKIKSTMGGLE